MNLPAPLFLDEEQVRQHLRMSELIPAMEKALADFSGGNVVQPVQMILDRIIDPGSTANAGLDIR